MRDGFRPLRGTGALEAECRVGTARVGGAEPGDTSVNHERWAPCWAEADVAALRAGCWSGGPWA